MRFIDRKRFSRRSMLRGLAGGAVVAPFLPYLQSHAEADGVTPTRLLLLQTSEAPIYHRWIPSATRGSGRVDTTDFTLNETSAPLGSVASDIVIVAGVNKRPGRTSRHGGQHDQGFAHTWTAEELSAGDLRTSNGATAGWGRGTSVDQHIADRLAPATRFRTLELGVMCARHDPGTRMIYAGPGRPIQPRTNPYEVFDDVFSDVAGETAEQVRIRTERRSVIDAVLGNLQSVRARVGAADRHKIDAHLTHLRSIESRLQGAGLVCDRPDDLGRVVDHRDGQDNSANVPLLFDLQMDLAVLALACDATRIVSLQVGRALSGFSPVWLGIDEGNHTIGHYDWRDTPEGNALRDKCARVDFWRHEKFTRLVESMRDHGLLDESLVVWNQELGQTNSHNMNPTPFVLAGRANGALRTGRFVDYGDGRSQAQERCEGPRPNSSCIGEPHPKLLVDICRTMGPDVPGLGDSETYGNTSMYDGRGGLPGLFDH